jgi:hypothetical protein
MTEQTGGTPQDADAAPDPDSPEFLQQLNTVEKTSPDTTADAPATDATLLPTDPASSGPDSST